MFLADDRIGPFEDMDVHSRLAAFIVYLGLTCFVNFSYTTCIPKTFKSSSFVCVCNSTYCDTVPPVVKLDKKTYGVYQSGAHSGRLTATYHTFEQQPSIKTNLIKITRNVTYQKIIGFGGAMTDAAGINIASVSNKTGDNIIKAYYSDEGIEYNVARIPMASCDFSTHPYSYNDNPGDLNQTKFTLAKEDLELKIPYLKRAQELSKKNLGHANPWSAPAWMKTNNNMTGNGTLKGQPGGPYYKSWAQYFVRFLDAYAEHDLKLWGLTAQNEPTDGYFPHFPFQAMGWYPEQQRDFVKLDLGPALHNAGYEDVKLMILDDQRLLLPYWADKILEDQETWKYVSGIAVHWYMDFLAPTDSLDLTHRNNPDFFMFGTEACIEHIPGIPLPVVQLGDWGRAERYAHDIIQDLNHWVTGWTDWNIALNLEGGPNWVNNFADSPIIVNSETDEFYKQPMFYAMGHFSKFIPEGSLRIESSCVSGLECVAVQCPDNGIVVVVLNRGYEDVVLSIADEVNGYVNSKIPAFSIQTYIYWTE